MSPVSVQELRCAHLWFEQDRELLEEPAPTGELGFLRVEAQYWSRFEAVRNFGGDEDGLTPPWPEHLGKSFWSLYLGQRPQEAGGPLAWNRLIPFRKRVPDRISFPDTPIRADAEVFYFPLGRALLLSARLAPGKAEGGLGLDELVALAQATRSEGELRVERPDGSAVVESVKAFAGRVLAELRETARGTGSRVGDTSVFSVSTVIQAGGQDLSKPVPPQGEIHRVAAALSRWPSPATWKIMGLPSTMDEALSDVDDVPGHFHLTHREGRVSWLPGVGVKRARCFHRNQAFAALQVEALGRLVQMTAPRAALPASHERLARKAAGLMRRIYGGTPDTYRSRACRNQMSDRGYLTDLETLGSRWGWAPLA